MNVVLLRSIPWAVICLICVFSHGFAAEGALNLSGKWNSNLGAVTLTQRGNQIRGTLRFSNGALATITGTLQGNQLTFRWSIANSQVAGSGTLTANNDGNRLSGKYTDRSTEESGVFNLSRRDPRSPRPNRPVNPRPSPQLPQPSPAKPINVAGKWKSNLGSVNFTQKENKVSGKLRFTGGGVADITGIVTGNTLSFNWNIGQAARGDGKLSGNSTRLAGTYSDRSQGTSGRFVLTRPAAAARERKAGNYQDELHQRVVEFNAVKLLDTVVAAPLFEELADVDTAALRKVISQLRSGDRIAARASWKAYVKRMAAGTTLANVERQINVVLRETYVQQNAEAMRRAALLERYQQLREELKAIERELGIAGDEDQLANLELQDMLQKRQQTLQTLSNTSKMLHDTASSVIRKVGD